MMSSGYRTLQIQVHIPFVPDFDRFSLIMILFLIYPYLRTLQRGL